MKRASILVLIVLAFAATGRAVELHLGFCYGARSFNDRTIRDRCGSRDVVRPYLGLRIIRGVTIGIDYEGFRAEGMMPCGERTSQIRLHAWEAFVSYEVRLGKFQPFVRAGYGRFRFDQEIGTCIRGGHTKNPVCLEGFSSSATATAPHVALGIGFAPVRALGFTIEAKYVPLKMRPGSGLVDLGGWRLSGGIEVALDL